MEEQLLRGGIVESQAARVAHRTVGLPVGELTLLPIQPVAEEAIEHIVGQLRSRGIEVLVKPSILRPAGSYDARRRQLRADVLLTRVALESERPVVGLTDADCYAPPLNFVFGVAHLRGNTAVVSLARLRTRAGEDTFMARAMKEIFHEAGHGAGLQHCRNPRCVMHFSDSLAETDAKDERLCAACQRRLSGRR
jgi:archaemetzincin